MSHVAPSCFERLKLRETVSGPMKAEHSWSYAASLPYAWLLVPFSAVLTSLHVL